MYCDVNQDSSVTLQDLFAILRHIVGQTLIPGDVDDPATPLWAADANGDELVNIIDLMICINKAVGHPDPKVVAPQLTCSDVMALSGRTVSLPVEVASERDVAGLLLRFSYDQSALTISKPALTERAAGMELDYGLVDGQLMVLISSRSGQVIKAGSGAVVKVPFEVSENVHSQVAIEVVEPIVFTAEQVYVEAGSMVTVKVENLIPTEYSLGQNYPNPFNPTTQFAVDVPKLAMVDVSVYDILGRKVATLISGEMEAGYHTIEWNSVNSQNQAVSSGIYFVRMTSDQFNAVRKVILMK
jgi:hypothetical protein